MQTLSLQRLTYSRRKQSHDVNAPISFLIKKKGALLSLMVQLHYCQNHSVCISVPQSPKSWQQTASPLMLQDKYWTGLHATKASRAALLQPNQAQPVCLGKCVSEWTRSNCFSRLWGRKGKSVCLHSSFPSQLKMSVYCFRFALSQPSFFKFWRLVSGNMRRS